MARGWHAESERTDDWGKIQQYCLWSEQEMYESMRPCLVFQESAAARSREIDIPERTISRRVKCFQEEGMPSLFDQEATPAPDTEQSLPQGMRQLIVNLHAEAPMMPFREIAQVCYIRFSRRTRAS